MTEDTATAEEAGVGENPAGNQVDPNQLLLEAIAKAHDLLSIGTFQVQYAQDVLNAQTFLKAWYVDIKAKVDKANGA